MLSNTAVPRYYGEFRERVLNQQTYVNEKVSLQMNRIDAMIEDPSLYYDDEATERFIRFCENELCLTDGSDLHMLDSFKLWAEDVLSWFYFTERSVYVPNADGNAGRYVRRRIKRRLRNKQFLIVGRGASKTVYETCMQAYFENCDKHTTEQITTAPTMNMADAVMSTYRTAIARAKGPLFKFLTEGDIHATSNRANRVKLASTKKGIQNFLTNSILEVKPMRIDKLQGLRCKIATIDEWLSGDIKEDVVGAIEQGASKNEDYLIIAVSSEGTVRNGPGDTIKMELDDILKGKYNNPHVSIWWYCLDSIDEVNDPAMWVKANPNIGKTVSYEVYQLDVERAENAPSVRNDILAKRFGIPAEGYTYYFTYEETLPHRYRSYWKMAASMGGDMSQGDDFCAFTFMFPLQKDVFGIKCRSYISERTMMKLPRAMREKYDEFVEEGSLIVLEGAILDIMEVYDDLDRFILDNSYDVRTFGYDPYNAKEFVERWSRENTEYGVVKVAQGVRTESVPLGELKILSEDRCLLFDESIMQFCMGNCIVLKDNNNNKKLYKAKREEKIDNVSAMLDAYVAFKSFPDFF